MTNEKMKQAQADWSDAYNDCMSLMHQMELLDVEDPLHGVLLAEFEKAHWLQLDAGVRIKRLSTAMLEEMDARLMELNPRGGDAASTIRGG